jgi:hypothetical protein
MYATDWWQLTTMRQAEQVARGMKCFTIVAYKNMDCVRPVPAGFTA